MACKRCFFRWMALFLALGLLAGCAAGQAMAPAPSLAPKENTVETELESIHALGNSPDDDYRTWYELFVYSFCDSNGDGIGDLAGVESKLDYLQQLGVTGIWLMPVCPSPSYHKYDVTDYQDIDPQYGTLADFDSLAAACHAHGIRLITDLVVNHTSAEHPWFQKATDYLKKLPAGAEPDPTACPEVAYYNFTRTSQPPTGWKPLSGTDWAYEAQFSTGMPDLNWDNPAVKGEVQKIMKFWLDRGVDGFRLDAAKEYYTGNADKNSEVLSWLEDTARAINPNAYLVAEVWDTFGTITSYYKSGITSIFDYPFGNSDGQIIKTLRGAGKENVVSKYAASLQKAEKAYRASNQNFIDAPFLSNHDVGRICGFVAGDERKIKLAGAMNLFMGGGAFLYYGEELGMPGSGNDPSKRAPFLWNDAGDDGTTQPPPGCTVQSATFGSLATQQGNSDSVYNYYRRAVAIRNALPMIARGSSNPYKALNTGCISAIEKDWQGQKCLILYNISEEPVTCATDSLTGWQLAASLSADENSVTLAEDGLTLPAYGVAILLPAAETDG